MVEWYGFEAVRGVVCSEMDSRRGVEEDKGLGVVGWEFRATACWTPWWKIGCMINMYEYAFGGYRLPRIARSQQR